MKASSYFISFLPQSHAADSCLSPERLMGGMAFPYLVSVTSVSQEGCGRESQPDHDTPALGHVEQNLLGQAELCFSLFICLYSTKPSAGFPSRIQLLCVSICSMQDSWLLVPLCGNELALMCGFELVHQSRGR